MQLSSRQEIRILHVDDDPSFTDLTGTFLERENDRFTVETATSADEGLQILSDPPPDCVVSDYNMPGIDGLEFLRTLRETQPDLPFILFTGRGSEAVASDAISAGVTDYLQKGSGSERYELLANRIENAVRSRREAERADRHEELMRLTEFAGDTGGFELDIDTGEVIRTDGTRRILNIPEQANPDFEEMSQRYHPDDRENIRQAVQRAIQTGEQTQGTWRYQHPAGEEKLLDVTYTPVTANGDTTTIRGAIQDVTDRRERQQELRRLQQSIDDANVPITLADPSQEDDPLVYVNDAFEEVTGYPPEETLGRNCRFLQGEDTDPEKVAALREAIDNEETISVELRNYRKDGTEFWNRLTVTPIYDDGQLVRYLGTQGDITERKQREQELQELKGQYETLVESFPDGAVYLIDTELECVRAGGEELGNVGLSPGDLEGTRPHDLFPEEIADERCHYYEEALDGNADTFEQEYRGERYRIQTAPIRANGDGIERVMAVSQNVSERKEDKRKLERQNERLEEFASIVSHDLRNPLQVADGRLELIQEEWESDHIDDIAQALDRMDALIEDMLTLAREGEQVDDTDLVGLANVAKNSWQTVSTEQAALETDTSRSVKANQNRIRQLFENLYRNAVEHGGDDVTVSVGTMDDGFYVADTGPGIPETDRQEVFEAGYSTSKGGTGFGLRIVEQIVDAHGWEVHVTESEQGGARFEVTGVELVD